MPSSLHTQMMELSWCKRGVCCGSPLFLLAIDHVSSRQDKLLKVRMLSLIGQQCTKQLNARFRLRQVTFPDPTTSLDGPIQPTRLATWQIHDPMLQIILTIVGIPITL